jgi:cell wall-active antibiotic response 4TMS protein YvqF
MFATLALASILLFQHHHHGTTNSQQPAQAPATSQPSQAAPPQHDHRSMQTEPAQDHDMAGMSDHDHAGMAEPGPDPDSLRNHHIAGFGIVFLALLTYLEERNLAKLKYLKFFWPVLLYVIGFAVLIWSDPGTWPDGDTPLSTQPEAIQHKIFALIALAIATVELFRRTGTLTHFAWRGVLSGAILIAGVFLLFHHGRHVHVVHLQHRAMGLTAALLGFAKFREPTLDGSVGAERHMSVGQRVRSHLPSFLTLVLGLMFVFYFE